MRKRWAGRLFKEPQEETISFSLVAATRPVAIEAVALESFEIYCGVGKVLHDETYANIFYIFVSVFCFSVVHVFKGTNGRKDGLFLLLLVRLAFPCP